jgi:hypothetical protein
MDVIIQLMYFWGVECVQKMKKIDIFYLDNIKKKDIKLA